MIKFRNLEFLCQHCNLFRSLFSFRHFTFKWALFPCSACSLETQTADLFQECVFVSPLRAAKYPSSYKVPFKYGGAKYLNLIFHRLASTEDCKNMKMQPNDCRISHLCCEIPIKIFQIQWTDRTHSIKIYLPHTKPNFGIK